MDKTVQELKVLIRELILEIGELKERVSALENALSREMQEPPQPVREHSQLNLIKLEGESYAELGKIYREGYHVCPTFYGEPRTEECLFCIAFMERK